MPEIYLFPGARSAAVRATAEAAFRMPPEAGDRFVVEEAQRHAAALRTFGDDERVIQADAAGLRRAVEDEVTERHVEAVRADPEERKAARDIVSAVFAKMKG